MPSWNSLSPLHQYYAATRFGFDFAVDAIDALNFGPTSFGLGVRDDAPFRVWTSCAGAVRAYQLALEVKSLDPLFPQQWPTDSKGVVFGSPRERRHSALEAAYLFTSTIAGNAELQAVKTLGSRSHLQSTSQLCAVVDILAVADAMEPKAEQRARMAWLFAGFACEGLKMARPLALPASLGISDDALRQWYAGMQKALKVFLAYWPTKLEFEEKVGQIAWDLDREFRAAAPAEMDQGSEKGTAIDEDPDQTRGVDPQKLKAAEAFIRLEHAEGRVPNAKQVGLKVGLSDSTIRKAYFPILVKTGEFKTIKGAEGGIGPAGKSEI